MAAKKAKKATKATKGERKLFTVWLTAAERKALEKNAGDASCADYVRKRCCA